MINDWLINCHKSDIYLNGVYCEEERVGRTSSGGIPAPPPAPPNPQHHPPTPASAEWIRKERLGKMGEFRYF